MTYSIGNASKQRLINPDFNMTPGSPYRLTCPKCGGRKLIGSIASGNTFGEMIWSDTKHDYPMLPRPSSIQCCPDCGHYYFLDDGNPVNTRKGSFLFDFGELSFEQINEAYDELYSETLGDKYKNEVLFLWLFKYNDRFGGRQQNENLETCPASLADRRSVIIGHIFDLYTENTLLVAELHRELGNFDKCIELASPLTAGESFSAKVAKRIIDHAKEQDTLVFRLC